MDRLQYQISREVRNIITELHTLKEFDIAEYCLQRDELKKEVGEEFYNQWFKEALEI